MNIEVTTVSKKEQKASQSPAAIYVITQEDIRRSGMTNVPDLLRMVPGLQVAQAQGGQWAVSARGFNDAYSNKLLVLLDGMTVYSPIYSGVFWDEQNILLENIERIEVIRGPGATLWGANAVNGVINIITKAARDTQGVLVTGGAGSGGQGLGGVRFGGALGDRGRLSNFRELPPRAVPLEYRRGSRHRWPECAAPGLSRGSEAFEPGFALCEGRCVPQRLRVRHQR